MDVNKLNCKAELWHKDKVKNKIGEYTTVEAKIKDIYCNIVPFKYTSSDTTAGNTVISHTHKFICRYKSITPNLGMYFKFLGARYEFVIWNPSFKDCDFIEIFANQILE